VTARDALPYPAHNEAAEAVYRLLPPCHERRGRGCAACYRQAEEYVQAVLPYVVRLAIERGALELVKGHVRTYRVVEL
jgi:hypothetical protein